MLEDAGVEVSSDSVSQSNTDYSALVSKIADDTDVVFLPWMLAANAQLFGDQMAEQGKTATIFGTDGVFSPQDFKVDGSYLSSFSPDVQNNPDYADLVKEFEDRYGQFGAFGLTTYPATQVVLDAVKQACDDGRRHRRSRRRRRCRQEHGHLGLDPRPDLLRGQRRDDGRAVLRVHDQGRERT